MGTKSLSPETRDGSRVINTPWSSEAAMIRFFIYKLRSVELRIRGLIVRLYIILMGGTCGKNLRVGRRLHFKHPPHVGAIFGEGVVLGNDVTLDVEPGAQLVIGNYVKITGHCLIGASGTISIGDSTLIAEFVSIRDSNHGIKLGALITEQPLSIGVVRIGCDVWIGRGAAIIKGAEVGSGAIVGANSVVRGHVADSTIVAGLPARLISDRMP